MLVSPHDPKVVYYGGNKLFRTDDRGQTWREVSPDLTLNQDWKKLPLLGPERSADTLSRDDGVSDFGTITTIDESPRQAGVIYVGTDDGQVQMTRDGGKTWTNLTSRFKLPGPRWVSRVLASRSAAGTAYVGVRRPSGRRLQAVHLQDDGLRRDVDVGRGRHPRRHGGERARRASAQREAAVRGHRVRPVLHHRRRRALDARARQPAARAGGRHRDRGAQQRSDPRHARPQHHHPRRHRRARAPRRGRRSEAHLFPIRPATAYYEARMLPVPGAAKFAGPNPGVRRAHHVSPAQRSAGAEAGCARRRS